MKCNCSLGSEVDITDTRAARADACVAKDTAAGTVEIIS